MSFYGRPSLPRLVVVAVVLAAAVLAACGTEAAQPLATRAAELRRATPLPAATAEPAATARPAPTPTATPPAPATAVPEPTPTPNPWTIPGVAYPDRFDWPRVLELPGGTVVIERPPQRIHTLSLGHDEILVGLGVVDRLAGVGSFSANETYSNVARQVAGLPQVRRDPEEVVALDPDLVIASKFTRQDLVDSLRGAGITVARTELEDSVEGHETNIRLLAYMVGAEAAVDGLIAQIREKLAEVDEVVELTPESDRLLVLSIARFSDSISAAGAGSTEGGIIVRAGGRNAAAEGGIEGHKTVSAEGIIALQPDLIVITQPDESAKELRDDLLADPALAHVPAVSSGSIVIVDPRYFTTLSHWNVRGIEEMAAHIYPEQFGIVEFVDFK